MIVLEQISDKSRLEQFQAQFPESNYLLLAAHAAFPVALTADLLYKIWLNFKSDENGQLMDIPLEAVGFLLNSSLCRKIGADLYEIHDSLRDPLLQHLQNQSRFGIRRIDRLAKFLNAYLDYNKDKLPSTAFEKAQRFTADTRLDPEKAARSILEAYSRQVEQKLSGAEVDIYLSWIKGRLAAPKNGVGVDPIRLAETLIEGIRRLEQGDEALAREKLLPLRNFVQTDTNQITESGFRTKVPQNVLDFFQATETESRDNKVKGKVYAILVGVNTMQNKTFPDLKGPKNDLDLWEEWFYSWTDKMGGIQIIRLEDEQATKQNIYQRVIECINNAQPEDQVLFYFSGHGENKAQHYLACYDLEQSTQKGDNLPQSGVISAQEFRSWISSCQAYLTLVLDTHSGSDEWIDTENPKHLLLCSTSPKREAYELPSEEITHGAFTRAFFQVLSEGMYQTPLLLIQQVHERLKNNNTQPQYPLAIGHEEALHRPFLQNANRNAYLEALSSALEIWRAEEAGKSNLNEAIRDFLTNLGEPSEDQSDANWLQILEAALRVKGKQSIGLFTGNFDGEEVEALKKALAERGNLPFSW